MRIVLWIGVGAIVTGLSFVSHYKIMRWCNPKVTIGEVIVMTVIDLSWTMMWLYFALHYGWF